MLNISDHIRGGVRQRVSSWHVETLLGLGLDLVSCTRVQTPRMGFGENREARVGFESIIVFEKGTA